MTDIKLLPLYAELQGHPKLEIIKHYARANVAHATAAKDAEIERLRSEVERLAEALLELCNVIDGHEVPVAVEGKAAHARAALRDHDQEGKDG